MKKLIGIGVLLLVSACQPKANVSSPSAPVPATGPGAATPSAAVTAFMTAAKTEDLQAVGAVWGDSEGLARDKMSRQELEMRTYIIVKCVRHDRYAVLSEGNAAGGKRVLNVQISKGTVTKISNFTTARGPQGRWFVESFEMEPLTQICQLP